MEQFKSCINPYVPLPTPAIYWFCLFVDSLCNPPDLDIDPYWKTDFGVAVRNFQAMVAAEFFRREFSSGYPSWRIPQRRGKHRESSLWIKQLVTEEAKLWGLVFQCLKHLQTLGLLPLPPQLPVPITIQTEQIIPLWLQFLTIEHDFLLQVFDIGEFAYPSGKAALAVRQSVNQQALSLSVNPMKESASKLFIDTCQGLAGSSDAFRKNFYTPMIRQRMKITQTLLKDGANIIDQSGKSTKRRK